VRLYELIPAFVGATLVTVIVSRLTRPPEDVERMFQSMRRRRRAREPAGGAGLSC
jgi:hypothetical protein